ncbi:MAG: dTMP kinase [Alphaproteobacteria bacterium]
MKQGYFISFEGGEGSGKSTQIQMLASWLNEQGIETVVTREPGGSEGGEKIRELLVSGATESWQPMSEILLFYAARFDHVERLIKPAMAEGKWVLCDRFFDSTIAYQGYGHDMPLQKLYQLNEIILDGFEPNITFLLDIPAKVGLKRANIREASKNVKEDRFENLDIAFHERLREGYLAMAQNTKRFKVIDAHQNIDTIFKDIVNICEKLKNL